MWFTPAARLGFAHPAMDGGTLIHSDLNPTNLIVTPLGVQIVEWAWATKAAAWVELALLVQWLIGGGHGAEQAEEWLTQASGMDRDRPSGPGRLRVKERNEVGGQVPAKHRDLGARPRNVDRRVGGPPDRRPPVSP
ncbi:hypothetical protein ACTWLT_03945 [Micromonospora sp. ZYX-F-536]|uniref:hypothetical protein n=1 Tax=Micromonospora sp. ZYX-F-536 TaxID=3457629 RepID=UPI004040C6A4